MSTKLNNSELKCHIEIEGVVLSKEAIEELQYLQSSGVENFSNVLADAISAIAIASSSSPGQATEFLQSIESLCHLRNSLRLLRKP